MTTAATLPPSPALGRTAQGDRTRARAWPALLTVTALLLAGCAGSADAGAGGDATAPPTTSPAPAPATPAPGTASPSEPAHAHGPTPLPGAHVHGVCVDPADGTVYVATHEGLFRYEASGPVAVGPVIDLMGFTVAGPGHFYASGHPGPDVDLPNPVGLIESRDGGRTWTPVSRQGRTDFHAMAASTAGVVGFDGAALLSSPDGVTWRDLRVPVPVHDVAASPDGTALLVTSQDGVARSADGGGSWARADAAPLLQEVAFADAGTAVGVTPDGILFVSDDAGSTWTEQGSTGGPPQAIAATRTAEGTVDVVVATTDALVRSVGGAPFEPVTVG